ncbi:MAG TPA: hypothetical protein VLB09_05530, partial [Nitrospiria bacterium]|nr:hypothetical protein [Nitrospiria bacterium]
STWREYFKPTKARVSFEDFGVDADWHFAMPGDDHVTQWRKKENGGLRWVSQPYYLELGDLKKMVDHAEKHDLFVRIDPRFSWHFPGYTMQVVWRKRL